MSLYDYQASRDIAAADYPFYGLIMAAMRQADTVNLAKLTEAFPDVWRELEQRYNAPGGYLPHELTTIADAAAELRATRCGHDGGQAIGVRGHSCTCIRGIDHEIESPRPHGCTCGAVWAGQ